MLQRTGIWLWMRRYWIAAGLLTLLVLAAALDPYGGIEQAGSLVLVAAAIGLLALYGLVRFVVWAAGR